MGQSADRRRTRVARRPAARRSGAYALVAIAVLFAAACSGDHQGVRGATTTSAPPTSAVAAPTTIGPVRPSTTVARAAPVSTLASGTYLDGTPGTPHYFLSLATKADGSLSGSLGFLYQDGKTSVVFPFGGTARGGVATLHPGPPPQSGSASQSPGSVPSVVSATFGSGAITLGQCTTYMHFATSTADCVFHFSSEGLR